MERRGRRIYLNEDGAFIEIRPWDDAFRSRLLAFRVALNALNQEFYESVVSFKAEFDSEADNPSERCIAEANRRWVHLCRKLGQEVNALFEEDISRMAFPDTECPDWGVWDDFLVELFSLMGEIYRDYGAANRETDGRKEHEKYTKSIRKAHGKHTKSTRFVVWPWKR